MKSVESRVITVIAKHLKIEDWQGKIGTESNLIGDLGADSLDVVIIIIGLEEEFRVDISDEDSNKLYTVGDCIRYIKEHLV